MTKKFLFCILQLSFVFLPASFVFAESPPSAEISLNQEKVNSQDPLNNFANLREKRLEDIKLSRENRRLEREKKAVERKRIAEEKQRVQEVERQKKMEEKQRLQDEKEKIKEIKRQLKLEAQQARDLEREKQQEEKQKVLEAKEQEKIQKQQEQQRLWEENQKILREEKLKKDQERQDRQAQQNLLLEEKKKAQEEAQVKIEADRKAKEEARAVEEKNRQEEKTRMAQEQQAKKEAEAQARMKQEQEKQKILEETKKAQEETLIKREIEQKAKEAARLEEQQKREEEKARIAQEQLDKKEAEAQARMKKEEENKKALEEKSSQKLSYKEKRIQEGYVVNLRDLVKKTKKKLSKVDSKIEEKSIQRRNKQREARVREYYAKAMKYNQDGQFEKARKLWEKAIEMTEHPEMKNYIDQKIQQSSKEEEDRIRRLAEKKGYDVAEIEQMYKEAVKLYKQKEYVDAKLKFETVKLFIDDYKAIDSYIMIIDQQIEDDQQFIIQEKIKDISKEAQAKKDKWKEAIEIKEKGEQVVLAKKQAKEMYAHGKELYALQNYASAKENFSKAYELDPDLSAAVKYLAKAESKIAGQEKTVQEVKTKAESREETEHLRQQRVEDQVKKKAEQQKLAEEKQQKKLADLEASRKEKEAIKEQKEKDRLRKEQEKEEQRQAVLAKKAGKEQEAQLAKAGSQGSSAVTSEKKSAVTESRSQVKSVEPVVPVIAPKQKISEPSSEAKPVSSVELQQLGERDKQVVEKALQDRREKTQHAADAVYEEAERFYRAGNLDDAQRKFIEVESILPEYKDTEKWLIKLDEEIQKLNPAPKKIVSDDSGETRIVEKVVYVEKNSMKLASQPKIFTDYKEIAPICEDVKAAYQQAIRYYKSGEYKLAKNKFLEVNSMAPCYKTSVDYLKKIEVKLLRQEEQLLKVHQQEKKKIVENAPAKIVNHSVENKQQKEKAQLYYDQALAFYKKKDYQSAKQSFIDADSIINGYKSTAKYLAEIEKNTASQIKNPPVIEVKEETPQKTIEDKIANAEIEANAKIIHLKAEEMYQDALKDYKQQRLTQAKVKFEQLSRFLPGYRSAEWYINLINLELAKNKRPIDRLYNAEQESPEGFLKAEQGYYPQEQMEWERKADKQVALLKAKEAHLDYLKGERYKEFKKEIKAEQDALAKIQKERKKQDNLRYLATKKRLDDEEKAKVLAEKKVKEEAAKKEKELRQKIKDEELAVKKEAERKKQEEAEKQKQEQLVKNKTEQGVQLDQEKAGQENQLAKEKEERSAQLAQEKADRAAQLVQEKADREADLAKKKAEQKNRKANAGKIKGLEKKLARFSKKKVRNLRKLNLNAEEHMKRLSDEIKEEQDRVILGKYYVEKKKDNAPAVEMVKVEEPAVKQPEVENKAPLEQVSIEQVNNDPEVVEKAVIDTAGKEQVGNIGEEKPASSEEKILTDYQYNKAKEDQDRKKAAKQLAADRKKENKLRKQQEKILKKARKDIDRNLGKGKKSSQKQVSQQVETLYKEAVELFKANNYVAAKIKFSSVEGLYPGYKDAKSHVQRIDAILANEERRAQVILNKEKEMMEQKKAEVQSVSQEPEVKAVIIEKPVVEEKVVVPESVVSQEKAVTEEENVTEEKAVTEEKVVLEEIQPKKKNKKISKPVKNNKNVDPLKAVEEAKAEYERQVQLAEKERLGGLKREIDDIYKKMAADIKLKKYYEAKDLMVQAEVLFDRPQGLDELYVTTMREKMQRLQNKIPGDINLEKESEKAANKHDDKVILSEKVRLKALKKEIDKVYKDTAAKLKAKKYGEAEDLLAQADLLLGRPQGLDEGYIATMREKMNKLQDKIAEQKEKNNQSDRSSTSQEINEARKVELRLENERLKELESMKKSIREQEKQLAKELKEGLSGLTRAGNALKGTQPKVTKEIIHASSKKEINSIGAAMDNQKDINEEVAANLSELNKPTKPTVKKKTSSVSKADSIAIAAAAKEKKKYDKVLAAKSKLAAAKKLQQERDFRKQARDLRRLAKLKEKETKKEKKAIFKQAVKNRKEMLADNGQEMMMSQRKELLTGNNEETAVNEKKEDASGEVKNEAADDVKEDVVENVSVNEDVKDLNVEQIKEEVKADSPSSVVEPLVVDSNVSNEERIKEQSDFDNKALKAKENRLRQLVEARQKELKNEREKIRKEFQANLDSLYHKALGLYKKASFLEAKKIFTEIEAVSPGYKDSASYLKRVDSDIMLKSKKAENSQAGVRKRLVTEALDSIEKK